MHIANLPRANNELLASLLEDKLRFVFREHMRTNDDIVLIGLSVNRDATEFCAFDRTVVLLR